MNKNILILGIAVIMTATVSGQTEISRLKPIHQIGIDLGGILYQERDDILAPLRWDGLGILGGLSYSIIGYRGRHNIELRAPYASLSNRYDHESRALEIYLGYSYMCKIAGNESNRQIHLGGLIDWNYNLQYYDNWDDSHTYWLNVYEIGPALRWSNTIEENHQLAVNLNFSLLALVSRPPEIRYYDQMKLSELLSEPNENMKLTSLHEYISVGFRSEYKFWVSRKITLGISYFLNFKTCSEPQSITIFTNALQLKIHYTFGTNKKDNP